MLTVTPAALDRVSEKLAHRQAAVGMALRISRRENGWKFHPDRSAPADTTIARDGVTVLLLDKAVAEAMAEKTLDVRTTDAGPRLMLR